MAAPFKVRNRSSQTLYKVVYYGDVKFSSRSGEVAARSYVDARKNIKHQKFLKLIRVKTTREELIVP